MCRFIEGIPELKMIVSLYRCKEKNYMCFDRYIERNNFGSKICIALFDLFLNRLGVGVALIDIFLEYRCPSLDRH